MPVRCSGISIKHGSASAFLACDTAIPQRNIAKHSPIRASPANTGESVVQIYQRSDIPRTIVKEEGMVGGIESMLRSSADMTVRCVKRQGQSSSEYHFKLAQVPA